MKILGLDLGVGSIGWAVIETDDDFNPIKILGMGSRIVSLSVDENKSFTQVKGVTKCAERTTNRTARKMLNRLQDRKSALYYKLSSLNMIDKDFFKVASPLEIWQLRADAATKGKKLTLQQIGSVLRHLCQKRGYQHSKADNSDSRQTEYVKNVHARWQALQEANETPGQQAARLLKDSEFITPKGKKVYNYRIKDKGDRVLPRQAYETEFDKIMQTQAQYYPSILTPDTIANLKNIIFYQRPLKSCKHLVSLCEFESRDIIAKDGKKIKVGPKVAPRTAVIR